MDVVFPPGVASLSWPQPLCGMSPLPAPRAPSYRSLHFPYKRPLSLPGLSPHEVQSLPSQALSHSPPSRSQTQALPIPGPAPSQAFQVPLTSRCLSPYRDLPVAPDGGRELAPGPDRLCRDLQRSAGSGPPASPDGEPGDVPALGVPQTRPGGCRHAPRRPRPAVTTRPEASGPGPAQPPGEELSPASSVTHCSSQLRSLAALVSNVTLYP